MTLLCAPRELNETVEENNKLRKQFSDQMFENQQQVSAVVYGSCRYFKIIVVVAQCVILLVCFFLLFFSLKESKILNLEQTLKSNSETMKGLEQKIEQDRVSLSQCSVNCQNKSNSFSCRIIAVCLDRMLF